MSTNFQIYTDRPTDSETDKHFLKMVKSCLERLMTCKSIENIHVENIHEFNAFFFLIYTEESKMLLIKYIRSFTQKSLLSFIGN